MSEAKLQAALDLAARGFRVFPLVDRKPAHERFYEEATNDPERVRALWTDPVMGWTHDYNPGISTDDLIVADVDVKEGRPGLSTWGHLGLPEDGPIAETPSGGLHVYYLNPGPPLANKVDLLATNCGVDVRSFHGYVVGPGATTDVGEYRWRQWGDLRPAPERLRAMLSPPREKSADHVTPVVDLDLAESMAAATRYLEQSAPTAVTGGRNETAYKVACAVKDFGLSESEALHLIDRLWNGVRCQPTMDPDELQSVVTNAYLHGRSPPGTSAPVTLVEGLSLPPVIAPTAHRPGWFHHGDGSALSANWLLYNTLEAVCVGVLVGPSGGGKSFVALELARCLATGRPFFGVRPDALGASLFLYAGSEGSGLANRMAALQEPGRLPIAARHVGVLNAAGALEAVVEDVTLKAEEMNAEFGVPVRLIVVETLAATGLMKDENDNNGAAMAMVALAAISQRLNCTVLITHHPPKEGRGERGAGAIRGGTDYTLEIVRDGNSVTRDLELIKARNAPERAIGTFTLAPVVLGYDSLKRPITSLTVSQVAKSMTTYQLPKAWDLFCQALDWALIDHGQTVAGFQAAALHHVRDCFCELRPGSSDKSNKLSAFRKLLERGLELKLVNEYTANGERYLSPILGATEPQ